MTANGEDGSGLHLEKTEQFFSRYSPASRKKIALQCDFGWLSVRRTTSSHAVVIREVVLSSPRENYDFPKHYCVGSLEAT